MLSVEDHFLTIKSYHPEMYRDLVQLWGDKKFVPYVNELIEKDAPDYKLGRNLQIAIALIEIEKEHNFWFPEKPDFT
jgi:hypothetical protein